MFFANPAYLFGLFGLVVPIAIHLWSKNEGRVIKVGSIQFLPVVETKKFSKIQINELWLLLIRCLLIALIVLIMAEPFYKTSSDGKKKAMFIEPTLLDNEKVKQAIDTLKNNEYELHWFSPGFPLISEPIDTVSPVSHWHLLTDLETFEASKLIVISNSKLTGIHGKRPLITKPISWITLNEEDANSFMLETIISNEGEVLVLEGESNPLLTTFAYKKDAKGVSTSFLDTLKVSLWADHGFEKDEKYVRTALETIQEYTRWPLIISADTINHTNWSIWLANRALIKGLADNYLVFRPDTLANSLITQTTDESISHLTQRLDEDVVTKGEWITMLFKTIRDRVTTYDTLIAHNDLRVVDERQVQPNYVYADVAKSSVRPMHQILWWFLVGMFLIERALSYVRRQ